jgi:hypothetical protein
MKVNFGFAFLILPECSEKFALLQAQSIRQYAGSQKAAPIYAMLPIYATSKLNPEIVKALQQLDVEIAPFDYYSSNQEIHYTTKTMAAGAAEAHAVGKVEQLIYCDTETLFLNDPSLMALYKDKKVGIRPVDIRHIGSLWNEPVDEFWSVVYRMLRVDNKNVFPVISTVDSMQLRAYFNACLLTVKPELGLLQKWSANLAKLRDNPVWSPFFAKDEKYRYLLHQAILAGTIMHEMSEDDIELYPVQVNFPLFAYPNHPHKPAWINDLISCRLNLLGTNNCWKTWLPMQDPVKSWLISTVEELKLDVAE